MTRRSFLFLGGAAAVGLALQPQILIAETPVPEVFMLTHTHNPIGRHNIGQTVADAWNKIIGTGPEDNLFFTNASFYRAMRHELGQRLDTTDTTECPAPAKD